MGSILTPGYLRWDGFKYVLDPTIETVGTAGGDLSGSYPSPSVVGLRGHALSGTAPTDGQVLTWSVSGSAWTPENISAGSITLVGDVTGPVTSNTVAKIQGVAISGVPSVGYILAATSPTAASWQSPGADVVLVGDVTGAADANTVVKIHGTSVPASPLASQVLVATSGITATWQYISDAEISSMADIAVNKLAVGTSAQILLNNSTPVPTWTTVSGDTTISGTGVTEVVGLLSHVLPSLSDGYLNWTGSAWALSSIAASGPPSGPAGGDLSGTYPNPKVVAIDGYSVLPLTDGYLNWTGSAFQYSTLPTSLPPSGSAGGDLSGTYPNPTVAKIDGASVPSAGSLTTGNVLQVNGASSLIYGAVNLAGGTNFVTGVLPTGNQAAQTMGGDVTGTTAASTVAKIQGNTVTSGALTKGQFFVASSASNWAATSLSGDLLESATTAGSVEVTGILNNVLPALSDGYLTWTGSAWAFTSGTGGGGSGFTAGGDLTGTSSSQQVVSLSGTTGSVQAQIGSLGAGAGAHFASKGVIQIPNNNNAAELDLIMARNNINTADINIIGYSFGVLSFGNTAEVVAVVGNNVQLNTASGTPFVVTGSAAVMQGLSTFEWSANTTTPTIKQVTPTSDVATNTLLIQSQSAFSGATGSNRNAGQLQLLAGVPASGGVSSVFMGDAAGANGVQIQSAALGVEFVSSTNYQFGSTGMSQTGTGAIGINNASVAPTTGAANGGQLYSSSNIVTLLGGSSGGVQLYSGDKTGSVAVASQQVALGGGSSCNIFLGTSAPADGGAGVVGLQSAGTLPTGFAGTAGIEFYAHHIGGGTTLFELNASGMVFSPFVTAPVIGQTLASTNVAGQNLAIAAQSGGTGGGANAGGNILISPGAGLGGGSNGIGYFQSADGTDGIFQVSSLGAIVQAGGSLAFPDTFIQLSGSSTLAGVLDGSGSHYVEAGITPNISNPGTTLNSQVGKRLPYATMAQITSGGGSIEVQIPLANNKSVQLYITGMIRIVAAGSGTSVNDNFVIFAQSALKCDNSGTLSGIGSGTFFNMIATSSDTSLSSSNITINTGTNIIVIQLVGEPGGSSFGTADCSLWVDAVFN